MIYDKPDKQNETDIMNPPESYQTPQELREKVLQYLESYKKEGKHREWYEHFLLKWLKRREDCWTFDVVETCLCENPPESYSDADYAAAILKAFPSSGNIEISRIIRLVRAIIKHPLILERNSPLVKELLSQNNQDYAEDTCHTLPMAMELYAATFLLLAESISLIGEVESESPELEPWEKKLLQQPNIEAVAKCIQSNFFISEKVDDYLDYIVEKGAKELTPLFVSLKYKNRSRN